MKINEIITENSSAAIATVVAPLGAVIKREATAKPTKYKNSSKPTKVKNT